MKTILLTGFEPFGGETVNPSWEAVRRLDGKMIGGGIIVARSLPVAFGESRTALGKILRELRPRIVICTGQAGGRRGLSIERVALNVDDARIPDNHGRQPVDTPVVRGGPAARWSTLPIKAIARAWRDAGIPASVSQSAGTYVCNHVFYGLMHALAKTKGGARGGFIHVPYSTAQAAAHSGRPGMPIATMARALEIAVAATLAHPRDIVEAGGETC